MPGAVHKDFHGTAYQPQEEVYVCFNMSILTIEGGLFTKVGFCSLMMDVR
jgi:hypothetical protein